MRCGAVIVVGFWAVGTCCSDSQNAAARISPADDSDNSGAISAGEKTNDLVGAVISYDARRSRAAIEQMVAMGATAVAESLSGLSRTSTWGNEERHERFFEILIRIGAPAAEPLEIALQGDDGTLAFYALEALARIRDTTADAALRDRIAAKIRPVFPLKVEYARKESDWEFQAREARKYGQNTFRYNRQWEHLIEEGVAEPKDVAELVGLLAERNAYALDDIVHFVVEIHPRLGNELVAELTKALKIQETLEDPSRTRGVILCLEQLGPAAAPAVRELINLLLWIGDVDPTLVYIFRLKSLVVLTLGSIGPAAAEAVDALKALLSNQENAICWQAVETLGRIGPAARSALEILKQMARAERENDGGRLTTLERAIWQIELQ